MKEIKDLLKTKNFVLGTERTLKNVKLGKIKTVYIASNCREDIKDDLNKYSKLSKFELKTLDITNRELGTTCKKPFSVSIIGVLK